MGQVRSASLRWDAPQAACPLPQALELVMTRFSKLEEFENNFESMDVRELQRWKDYWTKHAEQLQPKVRKEAMRRVHKIEKAIRRRLLAQADG